jgi:hypothetical protein
MTQYDQILKWMKSHKRGMTAIDAFKMNPPCTKLATRIGEMIRDGYWIVKRWKVDKKGKKICKIYYLYGDQYNVY